MCEKLLRALVYFGIVENFAIVESYPLPKKLTFNKVDGEWFVSFGCDLIIITPRGWKVNEANPITKAGRPPQGGL